MVRRPRETFAALEDLGGITAAVLAGGLGTRLRPVIADRPKVLADIGGRPCLAYLLDQLAAAGVRKVVLCIGHMANHVRIAFGDTYSGMCLVYSEEPTQLGTAGALRYAASHVNSSIVLAINGDSLCRADLVAFANWHLARNRRATILLNKVADAQRFGRVQTDDSGRIIRFEEKGDARGPGWVSAGMYLLNREAILTIPTSMPMSLERDIFPAWVGAGLYGYRDRSRFLDIGTPESYAEAERFFADVMR